MPIRKTPLRDLQRMKMTQLEAVAPDGSRVRSPPYRLKAPGRPAELPVDEQKAMDASDLNVIAGSADPAVKKVLDQERHRSTGREHV